MNAPTELLGWVLLLSGGTFIIGGGIGVLRMPDLYTRLHAASLTDTMGSMLVIAGLMLQSGLTLPTFKLLAILVFILFTAPTAAYAMVNTALLSNHEPVGRSEPREQKPR